MPCEDCSCEQDDSQVRSLKRALQEHEMRLEVVSQGVLKLTKLIDDVSRTLTKRITDLETELTYHTEIPHPGVAQ